MNRIKLVLDKKGIKQKWLAEQLGKSFNMVNSYVHNRTQPSIETLYKIASILEVEVDELLSPREDVEKMFTAIQNTLDTVKEEYNKKFEQKAKSEKKLFSFDDVIVPSQENESNVEEVATENN